MVYCSNCGEKTPDGAYFCPKCGTKTPVGKLSKATYPADELRDAFYQVGVELERAFTIAARETQNAFKKVSEDIQKKTPSNNQGTIECTSCGNKNVSGAAFCHSCGAKVASAEEPAGSNWNNGDSNKTLVAYESKNGTTEETARKIADIRHSKFQLEVDLVDLRVQSISNCSLYQNIVVGGGVRAGMWHEYSWKKIFDNVDLTKAEAWAEKLGKKFTQ